jgi:hypothetical protein
MQLVRVTACVNMLGHKNRIEFSEIESILAHKRAARRDPLRLNLTSMTEV